MGRIGSEGPAGRARVVRPLDRIQFLVVSAKSLSDLGYMRSMEWYSRPFLMEPEAYVQLESPREYLYVYSLGRRS